MNKKAFVLMETIVVIVVISIALLTIFKSYNKILSKVKTENKYDTSEYIYMTKYVKDYLSGNSCVKDADNNTMIYEMGLKDSDADPGRKKDLKNFADVCIFPTTNQFNFKKIYLLKYLNEIDEDTTRLDLNKFDAYMIDYLRKLDVGNKDEIIVVEYYKNALDDKGNEIYSTKCPKNGTDSEGNPCLPLTETYIASLEWN